MNIDALRCLPSNHEKAVRALQRQKVERTLACDACGRFNRPGKQDIELDDTDTAWCQCGACFAVRVDVAL